MIDLSIIMPVYNEELNWVSKSIKSILSQTYSDFEFIIVLDNPQNFELESLIIKFMEEDNRIRFYKNNKNQGLVRTLNKAISLANGKFIARMDADDISHEERFKKQIEFLNKNKDIYLVGTNWVCIDENNNIIFHHGKLPTNFKFIKKNIHLNNMFLHPSWMFRRELIDIIGGYREITYAEDYDYICRLLTKDIKISNINEYLLKYRVRSSSISVSRAYEQYINSNNAVSLMKQRLKFGYDTFNENSYKQIDEKEKDNFHIASKLFIEARESLNNKKYLNFLLFLIKSFKISKSRSKKNFNIIMYNIKLKLFNS